MVQKVLHSILDKLSIKRSGKRIGLHAFRHLLTSRVIEKRGVAVAQRLMRHSDPKTTLGYHGHVLGNAQREAVDAIEAETESVFHGK